MPMQIEKAKPPKPVLHTGLSDEVYLDGKIIGYVGFHECDTPYISTMIVGLKCHKIAVAMQTQIIACRSMNGQHFLDFEIMNAEERRLWGEMMTWEFPGDYLQENSRKIIPYHRILRITKKSNDGEAHDIRLRTMYELLKKPHRKISGGHLSHYIEQKIIPFKYFQHRLDDILDTEATMTIYPIRGEKE